MSLCETEIRVTRRKFLENNSILLHYFILLQMNHNVYFCLVKTLKITLLEFGMFAFNLQGFFQSEYPNPIWILVYQEDIF